MTRLQLEDLVANWLNDPNKTFFTSTQIQTRLNLAQRVLQSLLIDSYQDFYTTCAETMTIVSSGRYRLPTDFRKCRRIEIITQPNTTPPGFSKVEPMDMNEQDLLPKGTGLPTGYYILKNHLYLRQVPSTAWEMHMHYVYRVADIANDGDAPDIPADYHEFLAILAVRADLIQDNQNMDAILELKKDYETQIAKDASNRKPDGARMITATRGGYSQS